MPSHKPLPTIQDYLGAYGAEINGLRRPNADTRSGSGYDAFGGTAAVLFAREATRDRDLFRATYFDASSGDQVDELIAGRFNGALRIQAEPGTGQAVFQRPTGGTSGTFYAGTRVTAAASGAGIRFVEVSTDTAYLSTDRSCVVPVQSIAGGLAQPLSVDTSNGVLRLDDQVDDPAWAPVSLQIGAGTDREKDSDFKARTKADRLSKRVGYIQSIKDACVAVGAGQVVLFGSNQLDEPDFGINRCFVGFSSYVSTPELVRACRIAVDSARVLGADLVVMGMDSFLLPIRATVRLWLEPNARNVAALKNAATGALVDYFNTRDNAYSFRFSAMRGAVLRALRTDAQTVDFSVGDENSPITDEPVLTDITYRSVIFRYFTTASDVTVSITGPQ